MSDAIQVLNDRNISVRSFGRAVQDLAAQCVCPEDYRRVATQLLDRDVNVDDTTIEYFTKYLVQELVKQNIAEGEGVDIEIASVTAEREATSFVKRIYQGDMSFLLKSEETTDDGTTTVTTTSTSRPKKGAKKDGAARIYRQMQNDHTRDEIIAAFIEQLDMTTAGATTYFHNNEKEYGPCKVVAGGSKKKGGGRTKKDDAVDVYKDVYLTMKKDDIIELLAEKLNTTRLGAQTYYYAASAEVGKQSVELAPSKKGKK